KEHRGGQLFGDGGPGGEARQEVGAGADRVVSRVRAVEGDVLLFSSGHFLRVLAARWLGLEPGAGRFFLLSTASLSALGYEHERAQPVIRLSDDTRHVEKVSLSVAGRRGVPHEDAAADVRVRDERERDQMTQIEAEHFDTTSVDADHAADLLAQYGCGPVRFAGSADGFYERHLVFDGVLAPEVAGARERFEAFARSVRDVLSQRWVRTDQTYERENPKRVYYLSMEFLIGRSLANNVMNLLLDRIATHVVAQHHLDWLGLLEQEPDAGLGNGGLGRLAACFLDSMATMQLPAMGYGLRYEYGMFRQTIESGWQREN